MSDKNASSTDMPCSLLDFADCIGMPAACLTLPIARWLLDSESAHCMHEGKSDSVHLT